MDDSLARLRSKSTLPTPGIRAADKAPQLEPEARAGFERDTGLVDDVDPLPTPGSPYTAASSRPGNKPELTLHVMDKNGYYHGFAWSNFDSIDTAPGDRPGNGPVLIVRFTGLVPTELRISGSNLSALHAYLGQQRKSWIREQPSKRGFDAAPALGDRAEVITGIAVSRWKPEQADA